MANVPMNKRANTTVPIINFAKFGFLVTRVSSYLKLLCGALQREEWRELPGKCSLGKIHPVVRRHGAPPSKAMRPHQKRMKPAEDRAEREQSRNRADSCQSAIELPSTL